MFIKPLLHYLNSSDTGGKGIHYFYRDVCGLFIEWGEGQADRSWIAEHREALNAFLASLITKLGDPSRKVFESNMAIFEHFMDLVSSSVKVDLALILKLLTVAQKTHIWQIAGTRILTILLEKEYPLLAQLTPGDQTVFLQKLERCLLQLPQVNSKLLIKDLGRLYSILATKGLLFVDFTCLSGDALGIKLRDSFPRINRRLLLLLAEVSAHSPDFYLKQPCLRKILVEVFKMCNKPYILFALTVYFNTFSQMTGAEGPESEALVQDVFDFTHSIAKLHCRYLTSMLISLLGKVLDFDAKRYFQPVSKQAILIEKFLGGSRTDSLTSDLEVLTSRLLGFSTDPTIDRSTICALLVMLTGNATNFNQLYRRLEESRVTANIRSWNDIADISARAQTIDATTLVFSALLLAQMRASGPSVPVPRNNNGCDSRPPLSALPTQMVIENSHQNVDPEGLPVPGVVPRLIEEALTIKDDDLEEEVREDEEAPSQLVSGTSKSQPILFNCQAPVRFRKETNEMMPKRLLQMYSNQGHIGHKRLPFAPRTDVSLSFEVPSLPAPTQTSPILPDGDPCSLTWQVVTHSPAARAQVFQVLCHDLYSSLMNTEKTEFLSFLLDLGDQCARPAFGQANGVKILEGVFFNMLKLQKLVVCTDRAFAQRVNESSSGPLVHLVNEEVLDRLMRLQRSAANTHDRRLAYTIELVAPVRTTPSTSNGDATENLKRVKPSSAPPPFQTYYPGDLIDTILKNMVSFSTLEGQKYRLQPLSRMMSLPHPKLASPIPAGSSLSEICTILDSTDAQSYSEAAQRLIAATQQECLKRLHNWDQILKIACSSDPSAVTLEADGHLRIADFGRLSQANQTHLIRALTGRPCTPDELLSVTTQINKSKFEKKEFEKRFAHELSTFWFGHGDFNRARYFNELEKERIQDECRQSSGLLGRTTFFEIGTAVMMSEAIGFVSKSCGQGEVTTGAARQLASLLSCKRRSLAGLSEDMIFGRFSDLRLLINAVSNRFQGLETVDLLKVQIFNQINYADFLCDIGGCQKAREILAGVASEMPPDSDSLRLDYGRTLAKLDLAPLESGLQRVSREHSIEQLESLRSGVTGSYFFKPFLALIASHDYTLANARGHHDANSQTRWVNYLGQLISSDLPTASSRRLSSREPEDPDTLRALYGHSQLDIDIMINEAVSRLCKSLIEGVMNRTSSSPIDLKQVLQAFLDSTQKLFVSAQGVPSHHKMPFILRVMKCYPALCPEIFQRFLGSLNPEVFLDWIPQLISLASQSALLGDYFRSVFKRIALICPESLATHLFFKRTLPWAAETARILEKSMRPYFTLFSEFLKLKDPETSLMENLKKLAEAGEGDDDAAVQDALNRLEGLVAQAAIYQVDSVLYRNFVSTFGVPVRSLVKSYRNGDIDAAGQVGNNIEYMCREALAHRFSRGSADVAMYSQILGSFSDTFDCQNEVYYFFRSRKQQAIRLIDLRPTMGVIKSLMRPKQLTLTCSDNKNRHVLVKYGEDLQEDARIMTIFRIFNALIDDSSDRSQGAPARLFTYDVLPIESNFGLIEWVRESRSLKSLVQEENRADPMSSLAMNSRVSFMRPLGANPTDRHLALLNVPNDTIIKEYDTEVAQWGPASLKTAILRRSKSPEDFLTKRQKMLKEYALCCIAGYLIGIGDRHLDNILLIDDTHFCLIDFGCTFDFGVHLPVPELVPFRFTPVFAKFGFPLEIEGVFIPSLVQTLKLLKAQQDCLNDYIQVYLSDPIEKWSNYNASLNELTGQLPMSQEAFVQWKVRQFNDKLKGVDPRVTWLAELEQSRHQDTPYFQDLRALVTEVCFDEIKEELTPEEVAQRLMAIATSKSLLGRMWSGWAPFV